MICGVGKFIPFRHSDLQYNPYLFCQNFFDTQNSSWYTVRIKNDISSNFYSEGNFIINSSYQKAWTIIGWLRKWWILCLATLFLLAYLYVYFIVGKTNESLSILQFLINASASLAVILYVVYTRELTLSSQKTTEAAIKTAEANTRLVESMQSMLLEQWACELKPGINLQPDGEAVSKSIHVDDKHISQAKYCAYLAKDVKRTLLFKPLNCGSRPIILYGAKFQMNDTRSSRPREIAYDPQTPIVINKDQEKEIPIAYNLEGELEIRIVEISYQDGDKKQNRWIANAYRETDRYQEPEGSAG